MKLRQFSGRGLVITVTVAVCALLLLVVPEDVQAAGGFQILEPICISYDNQLDGSPQTADQGDLEQEYLESLEEAALSLRRQLKERDSTATVYLRTTRYDREIVGDLFELAVAHTGVPTEGDYLCHQYGNYSATINGYQYKQVYYLTISYRMSYFTSREEERAVDKAVRELLEELDLENASDYHKIKGVYDWLCNNVTYDYEHLNDDNYLRKHSAYAALIDRTSVCQGYAVAMYRLLLALDVDVRYVSGIGNGGAHGWNFVKLNGVYYNVDATWDAVYAQAGWDYMYFLKNDKEFEDHYRDEEIYNDAFMAEYPLSDTSFSAEEYTVIFQDDGGKEISRGSYVLGQKIDPPQAPEKAADNTYAYRFTGWDRLVGNCTGNMVFTAVYEKTYIDYTITFQYTDGAVIASETYHYGEAVTAPQQIAPPSGQEDYVFLGWDKEVTACSGDAVYTARFGEAVIGDFDGDRMVTNSDVVYLLWYTLFPEDYPVSSKADFDNDGNVTNADVVYLLWYNLFPEDYPLG